MFFTLLFCLGACSKKQNLPQYEEEARLFIRWKCQGLNKEYWVAQDTVSAISYSIDRNTDERYHAFRYVLNEHKFIEVVFYNYSLNTSEETDVALEKTITEGSKIYSNNIRGYIPGDVAIYFVDERSPQVSYASMLPYTSTESSFEIIKVKRIKRNEAQFLEFDFRFKVELISGDGVLTDTYTDGEGKGSFLLDI